MVDSYCVMYVRNYFVVVHDYENIALLILPNVNEYECTVVS